MTDPTSDQPTRLAPKGRSSIRKADRLKALAALYATPRSSRAAAGLPLTDKEFADIWGVHPNQITKDKVTDEFKVLLAAEKEKQARQIDPRGTAALATAKKMDEANDDLTTYQKLKGQLSVDAMSGDQKSLELWMKLFGQPFIQEEISRVDAVANLDDRALVTEIVRLVDRTLLISVMEELED